MHLPLGNAADAAAAPKPKRTHLQTAVENEKVKENRSFVTGLRGFLVPFLQDPGISSVHPLFLPRGGGEAVCPLVDMQTRVNSINPACW